MLKRSTLMPGALMVAGLMAWLGCGHAGAATAPTLSSQKAEQSYSLGVVVAQHAMADLGELETPAFLAGVSETLHERDLAMTPEPIDQALASYQQQRMQAA